VNNGAKASLALMVGLAIALCAGVAQAQLTVTVTDSGTQTTSPGSSVSAGRFTVGNGSTTTAETISSVTISISNPSLFSSMTLIGTGSDGTTTQTLSVPLQSSSTVSFTVTCSGCTTAGLPVAVGTQTASFSLSATIAGGATATPTSDSGGIAFASLFWPHHNAASRTILTLLGLFAVGMLWLDGRLKRRHLVALAIALVLAATEVGCGNCSGSLLGCGGSNTGTGSSDQQITQIGTPTSVSLSGVPADLGTITSQ